MVDLGAALSGGVGQAVVIVEPMHPIGPHEQRPELHVWVQATELGVTSMVENDMVTAWATNLQDGKAVQGATIELLGAGSGTTNADGLAKVPLDVKNGKLIVARKGKDSVFAPESWW